MTDVRDFTRFTSFCYMLNYGDLIPRDFARVEWINFVGCETGTTLTVLGIGSDEWNGEPPFMPFFSALIEQSEELNQFLTDENGAVVTYKRLATAGASFSVN